MSPSFRRSLLLALPIVIALSSCSAAGDDKLGIVKLIITDQRYTENQVLPESREIFPAGTKKIYVYALLKNVQTQTGPFPLEMTWYSPNDFLPSIAKTSIELKPPQFVGEFVVAPDGGLKKSAHLILVRAGKNSEAQAVTRFYVGMTAEEIKTLHDQEAVLRERQKTGAAKQSPQQNAQEGKKVIVNTEGK
jgi:hypothetical protein